ncbi:MAG: isopentenyl-diphosphate Delta-isomerase [Hyphomicrobiaceae bacterium]|nr:isopentenyl-diphosphate Delta-isomerase [Hyphomicrobiaceae bacterium]
MTSASEEHVIIVDADDNPIGTAEKLAAHRAGSLHRAFSLVIWNNTGGLLLQKRHAGKYHSGGLWTNACCGHPRPGEDVHAAALRRLDEEMGFTCSLIALGTITYRAEFSNGLTEHEIVHVFRGIYAGTIRPNPDEADGYEWAELAEVRRRVAAAPESYSVWFREYIAAQWPMMLDAPS